MCPPRYSTYLFNRDSCRRFVLTNHYIICCLFSNILQTSLVPRNSTAVPGGFLREIKYQSEITDPIAGVAVKICTYASRRIGQMCRVVVAATFSYQVHQDKLLISSAYLGFLSQIRLNWLRDISYSGYYQASTLPVWTGSLWPIRKLRYPVCWMHGKQLLFSHQCPGPWFNIKMWSYLYRKSHCGDKTVVRSSYLHNGISYTGKMASLYWTNTKSMVCTLLTEPCRPPLKNHMVMS